MAGSTRKRNPILGRRHGALQSFADRRRRGTKSAESLLISTKRPFSTGESWPCSSWFAQWSPDPPSSTTAGTVSRKAVNLCLNRSAVGKTANSLVYTTASTAHGIRPGSTTPLNQGGPPCQSPAWPRMAAGSDRFWLLELRVSRTFLDKLRPQLLTPWIPNSTHCQHLLSRSDRFRLLELRVSRTFLDKLRLICSVHGYPARRAASAADPDDSPRSRSTFREGGLEGLREWNPNRPVSEMAADRKLICESFEKQPSAPWLRSANARYQRNAVTHGSATQ
jgi:hypothetical protein